MTEKQITTLVCDLHRPDRPATHPQVTLDLCEYHYAKVMEIIKDHQEGISNSGPGQFPCPIEDCPRHAPERAFRTKGGLTKHLTDTHGYEPTTKQAQAKRNGNGTPTQDHAGTMAQ